MMYLCEKEDLISDVKNYISDCLTDIMPLVSIMGAFGLVNACLFILAIDSDDYTIAFIGGLAVVMSIIVIGEIVINSIKILINRITERIELYYKNKMMLNDYKKES